MADVRLKYIKNDDSYQVIVPKKIEPQYSADFLEFYETLVTVMNVLEYPYNTSSGDGLFPAWSLLRFSDISPENVLTRAQPTVTYEFDITIDSTQYQFSTTGANISTYQDLIAFLAGQLPAAITYLPANENREHQLRITSNTVGEREVPSTDPSIPPTTTPQTSVVDVDRFDLSVPDNIGRDVATGSNRQASVILPLPRFGANQMVMSQGATAQEKILELGRGSAAPLVVPGNIGLNTVQDIIDHINGAFNELTASFIVTYDQTVPTFDIDVGTVALDSDSSSRSPTLMFGLLIYIPLPSADLDFGGLAEDTTKARQQFVANERNKFLINAAGNAHLVGVKSYDGLRELFDNKVYEAQNVANGLTLSDVLTYTYPTQEDSWAVLLSSAIKIKPRNPFPLFEILGQLISDTISAIGGFVGAALNKVVDAKTAVAATIKDGVDTVLAGIGNVAGAIAGAAAELAAATGQAVSAISDGAARMLAAAKAKAVSLINDLVALFDNPNDISDELDAAKGKVDNTSVSEVDAPFVTVVEEPVKPDGEEVEENPPEDIFEEAPAAKDPPQTFDPAVPGQPLIDV